MTRHNSFPGGQYSGQGGQGGGFGVPAAHGSMGGAGPESAAEFKTGNRIEHMRDLSVSLAIAIIHANPAQLIDKTPAALMKECYEAVSAAHVSVELEPKPVELIPAVSIRKSITPDYIICLEDGKKFKSLKRHLRTHFNMTPDEYRQKWNLPADYPMVAPSYSETRSKLAKDNGLGVKR